MSAHFTQQNRSITHLGKKHTDYPPRTAGKWLWISAGTLMLITAAVSIGYGLFAAYEQASRYGLAVIAEHLGWPLAAAIVASAFGILSLWKGFTYRKKAAATFEKGFVYIDRRGKDIWLWDQIAGIQASITGHFLLGIRIFTQHIYTLIRSDGKRIVLDDGLANVEQLAQIISQRSFIHRLNLAEGGVKTNRTLTFGALLLAAKGVKLGKKTYLWQEIKKVMLRRGKLRILAAKGNAKTNASEIINLDVLVALLKQHVEVVL